MHDRTGVHASRHVAHEDWMDQISSELFIYEQVRAARRAAPALPRAPAAAAAAGPT